VATENNARAERAEIRKTAENVKASAEEVKASAQGVKDSARNIEASAANIETTADRSTELAADRTVFAAERTYAAWVRTGFAALASGVGARALLSSVVPDVFVMLASTVLVLFSAFCFSAAVWRELVPKVTNPTPHARTLPRGLLFAINGSLTVVALAALVGIWIIRYRGL
jgi:putative membrane protein